ncbi:hypothetical protein M758_12G001000 [Ceratodon purpureus]|nr:hypothetical protein M758_12G001000 [Ceratodon purpureus]
MKQPWLILAESSTTPLHHFTTCKREVHCFGDQSFLNIRVKLRNRNGGRRMEAYGNGQRSTAVELCSVASTKPGGSMRTECCDRNFGTTWRCCVRSRLPWQSWPT